MFSLFTPNQNPSSSTSSSPPQCACPEKQTETAQTHVNDFFHETDSKSPLSGCGGVGVLTSSCSFSCEAFRCICRCSLSASARCSWRSLVKAFWATSRSCSRLSARCFSSSASWHYRVRQKVSFLPGSSSFTGSFRISLFFYPINAALWLVALNADQTWTLRESKHVEDFFTITNRSVCPWKVFISAGTL